MKQFLLLLAATMCLTATAQFSNGSQKNTSTDISNGWSTVYADWNPTTAYYTGKGDADDVNFNAFSLGYNRAFALSRSVPIYLETGIAAQFLFRRDSEEDNKDTDYWWKESVSTHMLSLKVPVNVLYKWDIPNTRIELMPFLGINLKANVWGEIRESEEGYDIGYYDGHYGSREYYSSSDSYNLFSEDEENGVGEGRAWKRFQLGWQIGVKARFNEHFVVGGSFGTDFLEIAKKTKFRTGTIMIGYTF